MSAKKNDILKALIDKGSVSIENVRLVERVKLTDYIFEKLAKIGVKNAEVIHNSLMSKLIIL